MRAVVLAGGAAEGAGPAATAAPSALVAVGGGRAAIEVVLRQLARAGCDHATVAVDRANAASIRARVRDGEACGLRVDYAVENAPLGTAGPLARIDDLREHVLVVYGDVLTDLDFRRFFSRHVRGGAVATVAARRRSIPAGHSVLGVDDRGRLTGVLEKPTWDVLVRLGAWALRREALAGLVPGCPYGIDLLLLDLLAAEKRVDVVVTTGAWFDLGDPADRARAEEQWSSLRERLDPS